MDEFKQTLVTANELVDAINNIKDYGNYKVQGEILFILPYINSCAGHFETKYIIIYR